MSFLSRLSRLIRIPLESNNQDDLPADDDRTPNSPHSREAEGERCGRDAPFYPTLDDVLTVHGLLLRPLWRRDHRVHRGFPQEIVDIIIDWAEYWPSVYTEMEEDQIILHDRDRVLVRTPPLCYDEKALLQNKNTTYLLHRSQHPCRKIQFHLSSHDQGWGAGTPNSYEGSFTWFDVESIPQADQEILRQSHRAADHKSSSPSPPSPPFPSSQSIPTLGGEYRLQTNRNQRGIPRSRIVWDEYDITWRWNDDIPSDSEEAVRIRMEEGRGEKTLDGEFVRSLRPGDSVVVWGRARFPGWTNFVNRLSVRMFWAV